jgi:coenzyme F420-dependent oxidoreductase
MNAVVDLLIRIEETASPSDVVERAISAEGLGYSQVSMGETNYWNIVPLMTLIAAETDEIGVGNDVISPFGRSPAILAQTALTLQEIADDRFRLGLGPSSPALTENWHGVTFDCPLRRLRETIEIVRAVCVEGAPTYEGEIFDIEGLRLGLDVPETPPPIDVATLGPKATELAGRFGDGWVPQLFTPSGLETRLEDLERGADLGDRSMDAIRVSPVYRCIASEDREAAREKARAAVAFQLGAYGPYYGDSVAAQGYPDVVEEIREAWADRDTDAMAAALPDELLDALVAAGTPDEVRERVARFGDLDGVDAVRVGFINDSTEAEQITTMETIAELT